MIPDPVEQNSNSRLRIAPITRISRRRSSRCARSVKSVQYAKSVARFAFLVVAILVGSSAASAQTRPATGRADLVTFDQYVEKAVRDWHLPGLGIAVVKDDSLVFAKGYGVLDLSKPDRVTEHTRFAIGSTTKAMTAVAIGMLVDEGKLRFDDHVIDYLPELQLYDPYVTRELTIRDLLTHRSGLPGTDLLWARGDIPFTEIMRRLRYVKPASSLRSTM